ncbi:MAG TPA: phage tail sheath subtilisin-like domain-containing protein [Chloroflexaceae bacterium]|nr:phage tail sheath subtilisin-like domain-containing protein [Chloroflexaceae bacterium]
MPEFLHPGVYVQEVPPAVRPIEGASTSTAAFIGVAERGPVPGTLLPSGQAARPVLVTSMTDYVRQFGGFRQDSFLTYAVRAFYENGGRRLYIVRVAGAGAEAARAAEGEGGGLAISAANPGAWGNNIWVETDRSSDGAADSFKLVVRYGRTLAEAETVETFDGLTFRSDEAGAPPPANYGRAVVNSSSAYIAILEDFTAMPTVPSPPARLVDGDDGAAVEPAGFIGAPAASSTVTGTGLFALDKVTDVSLIAIPGQGDPATVNAGMAYCKNQRPLQDAFFIGDAGAFAAVDQARGTALPGGVATLADIRAFATTGVGGVALNRAAGDFGAIYFPWLRAPDPIGVGRNPQILLPPSGFMAGVYARIDNSRGVFKAPAGTEAGVAGVLTVATEVSDTEQDSLNPVGVNVIRRVPGSGFVVWGTRTIGSDPGWRYVPVRRTAIFLRTSIYYGIQWAVFEPNDEPLWASLRLNIRSFMLTQFRAGAFQGSKPDDAFFVKCDSSTTTQQDIDNGVVNILVGFAPLKPAEFVVLRLSQKVSQPAV